MIKSFTRNEFCHLFVLVLTTTALYSCSARSVNTDSSYRSTTVSYYADKFNGKQTASGEVYRHSKMTAAHKSLAFGTEVEIINPENSKRVVVTVNDRGPLKAERTFDLSQGAFKKLGDLKEGILKVKYKVRKYSAPGDLKIATFIK
ncbi:septal ring lytic transglycosylase RlpA family protein [Kaistella palustris]|uniref:septal ring lytic transglycosylase RlpA family protein n=1 Tax=Kaistella palustris TaxID=493376 RepID=UPI000413445C|nr:septal ring lytic transglycosylase RlpA family protein [Kaistella palustris]